jgi:hypothetical protein
LVLSEIVADLVSFTFIIDQTIVCCIKMHYQPISLPLCKPPDNETIALRNQVDSKIMKQAFDWMKPEMDTISQNRRSLIDTFFKKNLVGNSGA